MLNLTKTLNWLKNGIKTEDKILIYFDWNFGPSNKLTDMLLSRNQYDEKYKFRVTYNSQNADYFIVFNKSKKSYAFEKAIWFGTEPSFSKHTDPEYIIRNFKYIFYHNLSVFDGLNTSKNILIESPIWLPWYTEINLLDIMTLNPVKTGKISFIVSGLKGLSEKGALYNERLNFLDKILESNLNIDIYGRGLDLNDRRYKGSLVDKYDGLMPYEFSITIENFREKNYLSEKFYDAINCKTVPVYFGCTNVNEIENPKGFISLKNLDDITPIEDIVNSNYDYRDFAKKLEEIKIERLNNDFFRRLNNVFQNINRS